MSDEKKVGKDDRNFRSHYYEKVGCPSLEERKTLETLLNEEPRCVEKFNNFALVCTIPSSERIKAWKLMLGLLPRFATNEDTCWKWKLKPYEDVCRFMKSAGKMDDSWPKAKNHTVLWLLLKNELKFKFDVHQQLDDFWPKNFTAISESMFSICRNLEFPDVEVFYLARALADKMRSYSNDVINAAVNSYYYILANHSATAKLYCHLEKIGLNEDIPIKTWICRGFAGVLHTSALEKIWDKVVGGSMAVLVFVGVALVESTKMALQGCETSQEAIRCLVSTSEDVGEKVALNAVAMWIDGGCAFSVPHRDLVGRQTHWKNLENFTPENPNFTPESPNFPMATEIKIGHIENLEPIDE